MSKYHVDFRTLKKIVNSATVLLDQIEARALYEELPDLTFEQKVIAAVRGLDNGEPLRDHLSVGEIEQAVKILADVYTVTGVTMPVDWF